VVNIKDLMARTTTAFHETVFRVSNGRLLNRFGGMPVIVLTTTGRKSGRQRTTMLAVPVRDGDRLVIVASYGGDDRHPAWFLNLREHPEVKVTSDGRTHTMQAHVATTDEKAELWPRVVAAYKGYDDYQSRTERDIPLVVLKPS
jgi:deazaflavin-dependent oxidoreductase (nitroreductase family)